MFAKSVVCVISLFVLCFGRVDGTATVAPSNFAVVAGNRMVMECRATNESHVFRWELKRPKSSRFVPIFRNHDGKRNLTSNFSSRFGVDMDESCSGLLYTNTTQLDDAGLYLCRIDRKSEHFDFFAHLTVLESEPFCETNYTAEDNVTLTEGDNIWMQCNVNFRGMWAPTVEWKQHTTNEKEEEEEEQVIVHGVSTVTLLNTSITTTLIHVADFSKATYFSYRLFFQWHNESVSDTAKNVPNYNYIWKSPIILTDQAQLKTTEEVYVVPLPVEVGPLGTTAPKTNGNNDWYIIALLLLAAVLIFVTLLVGLGIRRYVRLRRARDINMVYNASTSSAIPLRRLDRPSSGEYDLTPTATPNIYDRIDGADADDDVTAQAMASQNQCDPQMTECYSGLAVAMANYSSPYDTLDLYENMDPLNSETDQIESKMPEGSIQVNKEERYTTPVPKRGVAKPNNPGSSNYLEMAGAKKKSVTSVAPMHVASSNDSDEDNYPDGKAQAFAKDCEDYLLPGPKATNN